jgi:hypothetical protein
MARMSSWPADMTRRARTLDIPPHGSRAWRLPSILFWLRCRRDAMLADRGEHYTDDWAWKRRINAINRRIALVEAELAALVSLPEEERKAA